MSKVNTVILNTRMREKEEAVELGVRLAKYESEGITIESAKERAKKELGLEQSDILLLEYESALKKVRENTQNFIAFNNAVNTAKKSGILQEQELEPLIRVIKKLEKEIMESFSIDSIEDLYEEEE